MKFYCRRCGNQIDLKRDRVEGKYLYICCNCETPQKKKDMVTEHHTDGWVRMCTSQGQFVGIFQWDASKGRYFPVKMFC